MNDLLELAIKAHGGLKRWNELESGSAHLEVGGVLWGLKKHYRNRIVIDSKDSNADWEASECHNPDSAQRPRVALQEKNAASGNEPATH